MDPAFIFKGIILLLIIAILLSLTGGMVFLVKDRGRTRRTVKSLTLRIVLSVTLFILLIVGYVTGLLKPHGLPQGQTEKALQSAPLNR